MSAEREFVGVYLDTEKMTALRSCNVPVTILTRHRVETVSAPLVSVTATRIGPWMRRPERVPRRRPVETTIATVTVHVSTASAIVLLDGKEMHVTRNPSVRTIAITGEFATRVSVYVHPDLRDQHVVLMWRKSRRRNV